MEHKNNSQQVKNMPLLHIGILALLLCLWTILSKTPSYFVGDIQYTTRSHRECESDFQMCHQGFGHNLEFETRKINNSYTRMTYHIAVLSAWKFRSTRMPAVYHTWGKKTYNLLFYTGRPIEKSYVSNPLIKVLSDVNDSVYPPQTKSLRMMQYWCDHLLEKYQWFVRVDDDVYVNVHRLERFLFSLNFSEQYYIGRSYHGSIRERKWLGLSGNMFCCGPTVIYSRALLQGICPYIAQCEKNTVTSHEDTEVGRCIIRHLGLQCAQSRLSSQMMDLFFHPFGRNYTIFKGDLTKEPFLHDSISLHKVVEYELMDNIATNYLRKGYNASKYNKEITYMGNAFQIYQPHALRTHS